MADESHELRKINWTQTFPFVRLFRTFEYSRNFTRLGLGLLAVLCIYAGGRVLDAIWIGSGGGVPTLNGMTEIEVAVANPGADLADGRLEAAEALERVEKRLEEADKESKQEDRDRLPAVVREAVDKEMKSIRDDDDKSESDKKAELERLAREADTVLCLLDGKDPRELPGGMTEPTRLTGLLDEDDRTALGRATNYFGVRADLEDLKPKGPFVSMLKYQMDCFSLAVRGAAAGRLGFSDGAMLGGVKRSFSGVVWLLTQRPLYAIVFGLLFVVVFGFFGGAISRHMAVQAARDESMGFGQTLGFARGKFGALLMAPLTPVGMLVLGGIVLWIGGLIAAIPAIGPILGSLAFGLSILGGLLLALTFIGLVLGGHMLWPIIAVESSDAFDAVSRAFAYVSQRLWNALFYALTLLVYGGLAFIMVRLIAMITLKMTHSLFGMGMSMFGAWEGARSYTMDALNAIWYMPKWAELSLLPTIGEPPFWGDFGLAPLSWAEGFASFVIAIWVYLFVSLVGAFVISFFFCGSTQIYTLLRKDVDATDYDEVYYEEEEELPGQAGTLPVVESPAPAEEKPESKPDEGGEGGESTPTS